MQIVRQNKPYVREEAEIYNKTMYIFSDSTDRNSGKGVISDASKYSARFGNGKHYPKETSSTVRGLDNAYPITTQRYYNKRHKGVDWRWNDEDFEEFKDVIDADFAEIYANAKDYTEIVFPIDGIVNTKTANISKERTPRLFDYLMEKCIWLRKAVENF